MPARSIATATISFGLVSVPVNIYSSAESKASVSFNMLHKKCNGRLKQQYICPRDNNEVVARGDMVKGYEFAKDQYVVLTPEELKALEEKATSTIDVLEFVPLAKVDREYVDKVYYLGPDKGGDRAYRLLAKALEESGLAALGQYAARGQQHLVLLRPLNGRLVMEQLHYADEVRSTDEVPITEGEVKAQELKLAMMLIDQTSSEEFDPSKYKDTVRERVLETIQQKVDGQDITSQPAASGGGDKILDLMEALKASLAKSKAADEEPEEKPEKESRKKEGFVKLLAGTSGYSFKEWKGTFYPADINADAMLGVYASKFPTIEINNTFYRLPKEHVLLEWASQVPDNFIFSIKASQRITHHTRLKPESESMIEFLLKNTAVLAERLGPILFQLPPNLKKDLPRLQNFLGYLPGDRRFTFEFRHESWWEDDVFATLRDRDIPMCISESADLKCPVVSTASWGYLRLHRLDYDAAALGEWAKTVAAQAWDDVYVYLKHDEGEGSGPPAVEAFVAASEGTTTDTNPVSGVL